MLEHVREICRQKVRRTPKDLQSYRGKRRSNPIQKGVTTIYEISVAGKCALFYKKKSNNAAHFTKKKKKKITNLNLPSKGGERFQAGLWIRIRIGSGFRDFVDPDPDWESGSGSRGKKTKKFQWKKCTF
jgi:hypothetical protein